MIAAGVALFIVLVCGGPVVYLAVALWRRNRELRARVEHLAMLLRFTEIRKEAVEMHCNELREVIGKLSSCKSVNFSDEQLAALAKSVKDIVFPEKVH